jgi:hypothetical protein
MEQALLQRGKEHPMETVYDLYHEISSLAAGGASTQKIVQYLVRSPLYVNAPTMAGGTAEAEIDLRFSTGERIVLAGKHWDYRPE